MNDATWDFTAIGCQLECQGRVDCDYFLFVAEGFPPCRIMMAQTVKVQEVGTVFGPKYCGIAPFQQGKTLVEESDTCYSL